MENSSLQDKTGTISFYRLVGKRIFDLLASFLGLVFLSPIFLIIAVLIRQDSKGPVFYKGKRTGRNGRQFEIIKFRTMYHNKRNRRSKVLTTKDDERITPFGRWLRFTKVNELPQLWNVLIGEMSLVGPRPEDPRIVKTWSAEDCNEILSVKPGITSPASIIYRDEEKQLDKLSAIDRYLKKILPDKLRLDRLYIKKQNFAGDLDVIFTTLVLLLPRLRLTKISEKAIFRGPVFEFVNRYTSWFLIDSVVAMISIVICGIFWRIVAPLELGLFYAFFIALLVTFIQSFINYALGLDRIQWRYAGLSNIIDIGVATLLSALLLVIINFYLLKRPLLQPGFIFNYSLLAFIGFILVRYRERIVLAFANRWLILRGKYASVGDRILIIGAGNSGQLTAWLLQHSVFRNYFTLAGFVDDEMERQNFDIIGYPVLGTTRDIMDIVNKKKISMIFYAMSKSAKKEHDRIFTECAKTGAKFAIIPDLNEILERSILKSGIKAKKWKIY